MTGQAWWGSSPYADFSQLFHLLLTSSLGEQPDSHGMEALREHVHLQDRGFGFQFLGKLASTTAEINVRPNFPNTFLLN